MKPNQKKGEFSPSSSKSTSHVVLESPLFSNGDKKITPIYNSGAYFHSKKPKPIKELMEEYNG